MLKKLNYAVITEEERKDAELSVLSKRFEVGNRGGSELQQFMGEKKITAAAWTSLSEMKQQEYLTGYDTLSVTVAVFFS